MAPSSDPAMDEPLDTPSSREFYRIIPRLSYPKWKLRLTNTKGEILYEVIRRPTTPPRYQIRPMLSHDTLSLTIRAKVINGNVRFILYKDQKPFYSIRPAATTRNFLLQDSSRRILARFIPITPDSIILRSDAGTQALIRAKEHPSVIGWAIESEISHPQKWLLAVLLFVVVRIEALESEPLLEQPDMEPEPDSSEVDSP